MLSVLIPTKDYDCHLLVEELHRQGIALGCPFEIILGEDGTALENQNLNIGCELLENCRRIIRCENIGRANIRNQLALEAKYPNILFIDSDAIVEKSDFLKCYIESLNENSIVCGGLYHTKELTDTDCSLRFRYEKRADESRNAASRNKAPYDKFTTFNFAIRRDIFTSIFFDTRIVMYGYEDTLFGKELEKRGHKVTHIDNSLLHNGLESNSIYLAKVEQSLMTLKRINSEIESTPLLDTVAKLRRWHMTGLFMTYWRCSRNRLRRNLLGKKPSLLKLNIYKLGYYLSLD